MMSTTAIHGMMTIHPRAPVAVHTRMMAIVRRGLLAVAAALTIVIPNALGAHLPAGSSEPLATAISIPESTVTPAPRARFADFGTETASAEARHVADWVADSRDAAGLDFIIIDKKHARMHVFGADARLRASTPVLLGAARGDDSVPGIGARPVAEVRPAERTTPAGRFVAERGRNLLGEDVVWVDYDAGVSMHRVRATNPRERRLERLATPTADDNRISYGCINVPRAFYEARIRPIFAMRRAVVYVLPESKPVQQFFGSYDVATAYPPNGLLSQGSQGTP